MGTSLDKRDILSRQSQARTEITTDPARTEKSLQFIATRKSRTHCRCNNPTHTYNSIAQYSAAALIRVTNA